MVLESFTSLMAALTVANSKQEQPKATEGSSIPMEMSTLENGKTIRLTVTGHITQPTEESIKVNGDLICGKAKGGKSSQMERNSMEITGKTKRTEKGSFTGPTGTATLGSSGTTSGKEKVL